LTDIQLPAKADTFFEILNCSSVNQLSTPNPQNHNKIQPQHNQFPINVYMRYTTTSTSLACTYSPWEHTSDEIAQDLISTMRE